MRRVNFFLIAAVASIGIFLASQAFARGTQGQTEYYRYQSSESQMNTTGQTSGFRGSDNQFSGRGIVTDRTEIRNPAYYDQGVPAQGDRYYYENREYQYSNPNAGSQAYNDNQRFGTTDRRTERFGQQYGYDAPDAQSFGYYENRPYTAYDRFGNVIEDWNTIDRPDHSAYTHPFYYQGAGDTFGDAKPPGGRYNPKGPLESIPR